MEVIRGEIMALNTQRTQVLNSCEPKPSIAYTHCMGASGEMSWTSANCQPLEVIDDCRPLSEQLTQSISQISGLRVYINSSLSPTPRLRMGHYATSKDASG